MSHRSILSSLAGAGRYATTSLTSSTRSRILPASLRQLLPTTTTTTSRRHVASVSATSKEGVRFISLISLIIFHSFHLRQNY